MSLEAAIAENTAALKANTEVAAKLIAALEETNAGRDAAVAKIAAGVGTEGAAPAGRPRKTAAERAAEKAAADEAAAKAAAEKAASEQTGTETVTAPDAEAVRGAAVAFMSAETKELPKAARKDFLAAMNQHFGVEKITEVGEDDRAAVIRWFEAKGRGEAVNFSEGEDDSPTEEDDSGI